MFSFHRQTILAFAAAYNLGMRRALQDGADAVLLLNNDTVCAPDMVGAAVERNAARRRILPEDAVHEPADRIWFAGGALNRRTCGVTHEGGHQKDGPGIQQEKSLSVSSPSAACCCPARD